MLHRFTRFLVWNDPPWRSSSAPPNDKQELGTYAKQLLDDPVLHLALERVEDKLLHTWKNTEVADEEGRERIYMVYQGMQRFRQELRVMIGNASEALRPDE
jgi:hypothetical protein